MSPDCDSPKCHENMMRDLDKRPTWVEFTALKEMIADIKEKLKDMIPKTWVWRFSIAIGLPLAAVAIVMWSNQGGYASKQDVHINKTAISELKLTDAFFKESIIEMKQDLKSDLKQILIEIKRISSANNSQ